MNMITVSYIFHSGFVVETNKEVFVFDYYRDPTNIINSIEPNNRPIYFISSHRHPDHFVPEIFNLGKRFDNANYLLSHEIKQCAAFRRHVSKEDASKATFLYRGDCWSDNDVKITACPSTDIGISTCVQTDDITIFHAGDLNFWHFEEERSEREVKMARGQFEAALRDIKNLGFNEFDIAMFPIDFRQGKHSELGAKIFLREFKVKHFFPMHFWDNAEKATNFDTYRNPEYGFYHKLTIPGESKNIYYNE